MRPGRTNIDAAKAVRAAAAQFDLADRFLSLFMGHGVGIGSNEPPYIGEDLPGALEYEFEPGMVFALEPLIWVDGRARRRRGAPRGDDPDHRRRGARHVAHGVLRRAAARLACPIPEWSRRSEFSCLAEVGRRILSV